MPAPKYVLSPEDLLRCLQEKAVIEAFSTIFKTHIKTLMGDVNSYKLENDHCGPIKRKPVVKQQFVKRIIADIIWSLRACHLGRLVKLRHPSTIHHHNRRKLPVLAQKSHSRSLRNNDEH